ncbi:MAG: helix-hairpin-helix domain-containing protein [Thermoanaerobacteraceae bacterium]
MFNFTRKQQYALIFILFIILFIIGLMIYQKYKIDTSISIEKQTEEEIAIEKLSKLNETNTSSGEIKVYVTGAVKNPGVYTMLDTERIQDALNKAGGILEDADITDINLAEKVKDEQMIRVFKKGEIDAENILSKSSYKKENKININTATKEELQTLPGIGPATSEKIIDFRQSKGKFKKIEDIMNVPRIGPKLFDQIKDKITVN